MSVLAVALAPQGELRPGSLELLGAAAEAGRLLGLPVAAAVVGGEGGDAPRLAQALWSAGSDRVYVARATALGELQADVYLKALEQVARAAGARVVILNGDPFGAELAPRLAVRLGAAAITDAVGLKALDGRPGWVRPMYGGKAMAVMASRRDVTVVAVRPRAFQAPSPRAGSVPAEAVVTVALEGVDGSLARTRVVERQQAVSEGVRLEDARIIVSGGRGIGGPEGFRQLEELARVLGGAVGASRAAVDSGWVPSNMQIGQTGKIVAPDLYIAVGISGASQHLAGVSGARHIVAINKDPEAPIFKAAEVGVVEDWRKLLPRLTERLREVRGGKAPAAG